MEKFSRKKEIQVCSAYLFKGWSLRKIESKILKLGKIKNLRCHGGWVAKKILDDYRITIADKGRYKNK